MRKSSMKRWKGHVDCIGKKRIACRDLVGRPEGNRALGRSLGSMRILNGC
jgi:hypothetical protein